MCGVLFYFVFLQLGYQALPEAEHVRPDSLSVLINQAEDYAYKEPEKAFYYSYSALAQAQKAKSLPGEVRALVHLGISYTNTGAFGIGFEYFHEAYMKCPREDKQLLALVCRFMARSLWKLKEYNKGLEMLEKATAINISCNDSLALAECYNIEGLIYMSKEQIEESRRYLNMALEINRKMKNEKGVARNLNNLSIYDGNKEGITMLQEAIEINKKLEANWALAENYNNLGSQYYYRGNYSSALECFDIAEDYARKFGAKELICDNYEYRIRLYRKTGNFREAFLSLEKLSELEKEVYSNRRMLEVQSMDTERRFRTEQQQLKLEKQEAEIRQLKRLYMLVGLIVVLIICLVSGVVFIRIKNKKRKAALQEIARKHELVKKELKSVESQKEQKEDEIGHYKEELSRFAYYIMNRNDLLEKIKSQIREIPKLDLTEIKMYVKRINLFISQNQIEDKDTEAYISQLEQINADFLERLMEKHPDLSRNEKRLASMLRIDLSTREIAILQGVEPKTISVARYRLRKRLGLETETDLADYMKCV